MRRKMCQSVLASAMLCVCCAGALAQEAGKEPAKATGGGQAVQAPALGMDRKQVSRMRGKLLYKKSQIRKLEKAALTAHAEVARKATDLERQRREMYLAVEPKLAVLYEDQDALEKQIREAAELLRKK